MPPGRFLSDAEIERLEGWPEGIERRDLLRYFDLDGEDLRFVRTQRGAPNQLGIALQLGVLRWLGLIPEDLQAAPADALDALAGALDLQPRVIFEYAVRAPTRVEHRLPLPQRTAGLCTNLVRAAHRAELHQGTPTKLIQARRP